MMLLLLHQKIALCSMIASAALLVSGAEDETTFDSGFGDWVVENGTWIISSWKEISKNYSSPALPDPPSFDNKTAKTSSNMVSDFNNTAISENCSAFFSAVFILRKDCIRCSTIHLVGQQLCSKHRSYYALGFEFKWQYRLGSAFYLPRFRLE